MPWKACNTMTLKHEFVELARQEGANLRDLCRRFCIVLRLHTSGYTALSSRAIKDWRIAHASL